MKRSFAITNKMKVYVFVFSFVVLFGSGVLLWKLHKRDSFMSTFGFHSGISKSSSNSQDFEPPRFLGRNFKSKDELWASFKPVQKKMRDFHQYCMLWCNENDPVFSNSSHFPNDDEYRGAYHLTEGRDAYQAPSMKALNVRCCRVAAREDLSLIYDSRVPSSDVLDHDVTLVTFGTYERIDSIVEIKQKWHGPVVLVLFMQDHNDMLFEKQKNKKYLSSTEELSRVMQFLTEQKWDNLAVIVYMASFEQDQHLLRVGTNANYFSLKTKKRFDQDEPTLLSREEAMKQELALLIDFPINSLRNMAQDFADTRYVLAIDIDFIPDRDAYSFLKSSAGALVGKSDKKIGIVLPHFERRGCTWKNSPYVYPEDFERLDEQLDAGLIRPFFVEPRYWVKTAPDVFSWPTQLERTNCKVEKNARWAHTNESPNFPQGINITDYARWFKESRSESPKPTYPVNVELLRSDSCMVYYEPYVMLDRVADASHLLMRYNEVFVARFRNKASWIFGLRLTGYEFLVANRHFLMHKDHAPSAWVPDSGSNSSILLMTRMFKAAQVYVDTLKKLKQ